LHRQAFASTGTETITGAWCRLARTGNPTDNVRISLYDDSSGDPGSTQHATGTVTPTGISTADFKWFYVAFDSSYTLTASTTYWIQIERTGSLSDTDYYLLSKYSAVSNTSKYHNGTSWNNQAGELTLKLTHDGENFYTILLDSTDKSLIECHKATDPTSSWSEVDGTNRPDRTNNINSLWAVMDDAGVIHVVAQEVTTGLITHQTFDTAGDAWVTTGGPEGSIETPTDAPTNIACSIGVRDDGDIIVLAQGDQDKAMGTDYDRVDYWRNGGGSWSAAITVDNSPAGGDDDDMHYRGASVIKSTSDRMHFFCQAVTPATVGQRTLTSANSLQAYQATGIGHLNDQFFHGFAYDDSGTWRCRQPIIDGATLVGRWIEFDSADTPTVFTGNDVTDQDVTQAHALCCGVVDGADRYFVYSGGGTNGVDEDIYYDKNDGTDTEWKDAVECHDLSANVYTRGGSTVIGVIYNDDGGTGTIKYDEISLAAGPTQQSLVATAIGTAVFVKKTKKKLDVDSIGSPGFKKKTKKTLTATAIGSAGLVTVKKFFKTLGATAVGVATFVKKTSKTLTTSTTASAGFKKKTSKTLAATAVGTAALTKKWFVTLAATAVGTATLAKKQLLALVATALGVAGLKKKTKKTLATTTVATAGLTRKLSLKRTLTATAIATATFVKKTKKTLAVTAVATADMVVRKFISQVLSATAIGVAAFKKKTSKTLAATAVATPVLWKKSYMVLTATAIGVAGLVKKTSKILAATAVGSATLSTIKTMFVTLAATATATATFAKKISKTLAVTAVVPAIFTKKTSKTLAVTATAAAGFVKKTSKTLAVTAVGQATLLKKMGVTLAATAVGNAGLVAVGLFKRTLTATAVGTAAFKKKIGKTLAATAVATAAFKRKTKKTLTATATGVAGLVPVEGLKETLTAIALGVVNLTTQFIAGPGLPYPLRSRMLLYLAAVRNSILRRRRR
jgi:hypothetical protein